MRYFDAAHELITGVSSTLTAEEQNQLAAEIANFLNEFVDEDRRNVANALRSAANWLSPETAEEAQN